LDLVPMSLQRFMRPLSNSRAISTKRLSKKSRRKSKRPLVLEERKFF
jgi:hypothetical protein